MTAFYVSASGKDNWAGTLAKPWRTIAKANAASLAAGDSVLLRRGDVWHEMLRPASGVTYGAYGEGDNPLLTADSSRRACVLMLSVHDVVIDRIDCDGPTSSSLGYDRHAPIYTDEHSSNITVKNLRVTKGGFGVQDGALDALDLDYAVGATNLVYDNIEATDCLSTGIYHRGTGAILNCKSHDNGLGDTGVGDRGGIGVQGGPLLIQGNEIWNIGEPDNSVDFAISLWRPQGVITISRNYIHDITCGCVQFYQGSDGHVVANNIFEDYGTSTAGDIDGKHSGVLIRYTNGVQVLHNVFSHGGTSAHAICHCICAHGDASDTRILNNICYECENPFVFILPNAITDRFVCDHNMFYKSDGNYSDGWRWKSYHAIDSLSAWCSATGQAAHSLVADPQFTLGYQLDVSSPAIDAGADAGITEDYEGVTRPQGDGYDIGPCELEIELPPPEWTELPAMRRRASKTFAHGNKRRLVASTAPIHYKSDPDSDTYDAEIDLAPARIDNTALDGWTITANGWHYALGQPGDKTTDGWLGFGGRRGEHWLKFRLARMGYLHWPTRAWDDIGGAPTYDRANLSQEALPARTKATWDGLWTTPGGGALSASWTATGDRLKEEVIINQAGRDWLAASRPPTTPATETYLGFVFQLDWSDIPKVLRQGIVQSIDADFDDDDGPVELRDALDNLLAFLPLSEAYVKATSPGGRAATPIRKRFWRDGDDYYLLMGARCDLLAAMPEGDLVFDPTVAESVGASGDDGHAYGSSLYTNEAWIGNDNGTEAESFFRWTGVTLAGTIDSSSMSVYTVTTTGTTDKEFKVHGVDEDAPAAPANYAGYYADTLTTANVDWDDKFSNNAWHESPSLNSIFQELVDTYTISNEAVMLQVRNDDGASGGVYNYIQAEVYGDTNPAELDIEYTAATALTADSISATPTLGTPTLEMVPTALAADGLSTTPALGTPALGPAWTSLAADSLSSTPALGTPTLEMTPTALAADGISTTPDLGTPALGPAWIALAADSLSTTAALGTPTLEMVPVALAADGISTTAVLGTPTVAAAWVSLAADGISATPVLGIPTLEMVPSALAADSISAVPALGTPALGPAWIALAADNISTTAGLGIPTLEMVPAALSADGLSLTPALGTPELAAAWTALIADSISTTPALGTPALEMVPTALTADNISTTPTLGTPTLAAAWTALAADGISATPVLGVPALAMIPIALVADSISTTAVLGTPELGPAWVALTADSISVTPVLGVPTLVWAWIALTADSISTTPVLGTPTLAHISTLGNVSISDAVVNGLAISDAALYIVTLSDATTTSTAGSDTLVDDVAQSDAVVTSLSISDTGDDDG